MTNIAKFILLGLILITTASCSDYWWTRGQAPSPKDLYSRSESKLKTAINDNSQGKPEISEVSKGLITSLSTVVEQGSDKSYTAIANSIELFGNLEGNLSYGSRPAYGELSGQLRAFASQAKEKRLSKEAFLLYSSRVFDFLSNELSVS